MSKTIKLLNNTYHRLEAVREKRETFSQAVDRLMDLFTMMGDVSKTLGPSHHLQERPRNEKGDLK